MSNNSIVIGIGGALVGLTLAALFITTTVSVGDNFSIMGWRSGSVQMARNIDKHFIEQMIPHHEGAVAMAELALERSTRSEIKTLATAIIRDQTREIQDMTLWYKDWFKAEVPRVNTGMMNGGMMSSRGMHMGGAEDIVALENATDFDRAFIEAMIPHHQMALMMVSMLIAGSDRSEMLQLAENITTSQSNEIELMQGWYAEWYK